jgi:hypothetical protein
VTLAPPTSALAQPFSPTQGSCLTQQRSSARPHPNQASPNTPERNTVTQGADEGSWRLRRLAGGDAAARTRQAADGRRGATHGGACGGAGGRRAAGGGGGGGGACAFPVPFQADCGGLRGGPAAVTSEAEAEAERCEQHPQAARVSAAEAVGRTAGEQEAAAAVEKRELAARVQQLADAVQVKQLVLEDQSSSLAQLKKTLKKAEEERLEMEQQLSDFDQCRDEVCTVWRGGVLRGREGGGRGGPPGLKGVVQQL